MIVFCVRNHSRSLVWQIMGILQDVIKGMSEAVEKRIAERERKQQGKNEKTKNEGKGKDRQSVSKSSTTKMTMKGSQTKTVVFVKAVSPSMSRKLAADTNCETTRKTTSSLFVLAARRSGLKVGGKRSGASAGPGVVSLDKAIVDMA